MPTIFIWPEGVITSTYLNDISKYKDLFEVFSDKHLIIIGINDLVLDKQNKTYNSLALFDNHLNLKSDIDIRVSQPKYGFISERKYILREVIRLREILFEFNGEDVMTSAKSAFIPKTRVQVYFLEDEYWFKPLSNLLYKAKNGRVLTDNAKRYAYFSKAVFAVASRQVNSFSSSFAQSSIMPDEKVPVTILSMCF